MVRVIVGTLIECGKNSINNTELLNILNGQDRSKNPAKTMPAKGLMLYSIKLKN